MKPLRLIAVWLLLLALPVQGLAAFAPAARCADAAAATGHAVHGDHQGFHDVATQAHDHPADHRHPDDGQPAEQASGHSCCHHVVSAVAPALLPLSPQAPQILSAHIPLLNTLFIPELPQRPPKA